MARLDDRASIKRSAPGMRPDKDFQTRLAIAEVVLDAKGVSPKGSSAKMQLIEAMIASRREQLQREGELAETSEQLGALTEELQKRGPALRAFLRRGDRLRLRQRNRLQTAIPDETCLSEAYAKLDSLYAEYYRNALSSL